MYKEYDLQFMPHYAKPQVSKWESCKPRAEGMTGQGGSSGVAGKPRGELCLPPYGQGKGPRRLRSLDHNKVISVTETRTQRVHESKSRS